MHKFKKMFQQRIATAFRTWGLPQLRRPHFSGNSFSVALKALFTIQVIISIFQGTHLASLLRPCLLYKLLSDSCFPTVDWSHLGFQ